jgi:hypothetical protein
MGPSPPTSSRVLPFSLNPFTDVGRAVPEFRSVSLAESKEPHGFSVDKKNVFQIDHEAGRLLFQHVPKHLDMFSCNPAAYGQHHEVFSADTSVDSAAHLLFSVQPFKSFYVFRVAAKSRGQSKRKQGLGRFQVNENKEGRRVLSVPVPAELREFR